MTNQEAIRILEFMKNEMLLIFDHDRKEALKLAILALEKLDSMPSAQPRPGKWRVINKFEDCWYAKCNQCNVTQIFYHNKPLTNFCPNCGAKMEGEE